VADFEWLSNNLDISYPFKTPAPSFDLGGTQTSLGQLIADAVIYTSLTPETNWKLYLIDLTFDWPNAPSSGEIRIRTAAGTTYTLTGADIDTTFNAYIYGRWLVTEWVRTSADDNWTYDMVVRLLWAVNPLSGLATLTKSETDWTDDAWFEDAVIHQGPQRVRKAYYKTGEVYTSLGAELNLAGRFNTDIKVKDPTDNTGFRDIDTVGQEVRPATVLRVDMVPGAGEGKYLRCAPVELRTINGLGPDTQGNFHLHLKDCYWLERPLDSAPIVGGEQVDQSATVYPNRLQLHNACEECCACSDYVRVYENLSTLWTMAQSVSNRLYQSLAAYNALRASFLLRTKGGQPVVKLSLVGNRGYTLSLAVVVINGGTDVIAASDTIKVQITFTCTLEDAVITYIDKTGILLEPDNEQQALDPDGVNNELDFSGIEMASGNKLIWTGSYVVAFTEGSSSSYPALSENTVTATARLFINDVEVDSDNRSAELKSVEMHE
jgi:hypothetical protein